MRSSSQAAGGEVRKLRPDLPAVVITGVAKTAEGSRPDLPWVGKPFRQGELARAIAKLMKQPTSRLSANGPFQILRIARLNGSFRETNLLKEMSQMLSCPEEPL